MSALRFTGLDPWASGLLLVVAIAAALSAVWMRPLWRRVEVAFVAAWSRALASSRRTLPWRELLAALLFGGGLAALAAGIAGPRLAARAPRRVAVVLDASASMQARDADGRTRMEKARAIAARLLDEKRPADAVEVFRASATVAPLESWEVATTDADDTADDPPLALATARAFLAATMPGVDAPERHLVVISDHPEAYDGKDVERIDVGGPAANLAVTDLGVFGAAPPARGVEVRVEVTNGGAGEGRATLLLHDASWRIGSAEVDLRPGARVTKSFHVDALPSTELWASLDPHHAGARSAADALAADDRRVVRAPPSGALRVALVTNGNRFLEGAIAAQPAFVLTRVAPREGLPAADVVVFDRGAAERPVAELPDSVRGVLVIDAPRADDLLAPVLTEWDAHHPATREVSLDDLTLASAHVLAGPEKERAETTVLAGIDAGPIAIASAHDPELGGRRRVELGFDPTRSDFPLRLGFPVFVGETIRWLGARSAVARSAPAAIAGEPIPFDAPGLLAIQGEPSAAPIMASFDPGTPIPAGRAARLLPRAEGPMLIATRAGMYSGEQAEAVAAVPATETLSFARSGGGATAALPPWAEETGAPDLPHDLAPGLFAAGALLLAAKAWWS